MRRCCPIRILTLPTFLLLLASPSLGFPRGLNDWQDRYGAISPAADDAGCQLCHADANGGSPWNGYGWDMRLALEDLGCDLDGDGDVDNPEALFCIETLNSDGDGSGFDNVTEIGLGTQPGWTGGPNNTVYSRSGENPGEEPPADIGTIDPDGTEPPPPPPPPPADEEPIGPLKRVQVVKPGDSIQRAIDRARPGGTIFVKPGIYRELGDPTNALNVNKPLRLIGLSGRGKGSQKPSWKKVGKKWKRVLPAAKPRVVLENAGNQRNGIVVVPEDREDCMSCHTDLGPPFPLHEGVEGGLKMREPMIHGFHIKGFTIRGFGNNGLFTENVDGFSIIDVESIDNPNYGIFPTLSRNGLIANSYASGSDDSGIWVETSEYVKVTRNLVEGNVNGFEVSNSDDVLMTHNEARDNAVGFAILLLPDIFDDRAGANRIDIKYNWIHDNNRENTARPGSVLATVPSGTGILHLSVDDSEISGNLIVNNDFSGIALADYCLANIGGEFDCNVDPTVSPEFVAEQGTENNRIVGNVLVNNGTNPSGFFSPFAGDLSYLVLGERDNCYQDNVFETVFSIIDVLPEVCEE